MAVVVSPARGGCCGGSRLKRVVLIVVFCSIAFFFSGSGEDKRP